MFKMPYDFDEKTLGLAGIIATILILLGFAVSCIVGYASYDGRITLIAILGVNGVLLWTFLCRRFYRWLEIRYHLNEKQQ